VARDTDLDRTRRYSTGEVKRLLGILEPTTDRLFAKARAVLGQDRAKRCLDLAKLSPLSRRWVATSAVAALVVGTGELGPDWWARGHEELGEDHKWVQKGIPDVLLNYGHGDAETEDGGSCLAQLGDWVADDAADKTWGRPIDRVDMSRPIADGRVGLPDGASAGDRLTAIFAPGGRVWVEVIDLNAEPDGDGPPRAAGRARLVSRLAERNYHDVAIVRSAWTMANSTGPIRLPGETPGRNSDPFSDTIDADSSRRLYDWAKANAITPRELSGPWRTKDALWSARLKLGLLYGRPGAWVTFDEAVVAVIDDDRTALADLLVTLER
jgi:hypothetical protein